MRSIPRLRAVPKMQIHGEDQKKRRHCRDCSPGVRLWDLNQHQGQEEDLRNFCQWVSKRGGTTSDRAEALNTGWHARSLTLARPPRFFRLASILLKRLMYRYAQPPVCSASLRNTGRKTYL